MVGFCWVGYVKVRKIPFLVYFCILQMIMCFVGGDGMRDRKRLLMNNGTNFPNAHGLIQCLFDNRSVDDFFFLCQTMYIWKAESAFKSST